MDIRGPLLFPLSLALLALAAAGAVSIGWACWGPQSRAEAAPLAEVSLRVDGCTAAEVGDTFDIDIKGQGMANLMAWEVYFAYDRKIVEVVAKDVRIFLAGSPGSSIIDLSASVPNSSGLYRIAAADIGGKEAAETGSGILAHLTLHAKAEGVSAASVSRLDFDGDGGADLGPTLIAIDGHPISDENGDGIFDGAISSGQIAVGVPCEPVPPPPPLDEIDLSTPPPAPPEDRPPATPAPGGASPQPGSPTPLPGATASPAGTPASASPTPAAPPGRLEGDSSSGVSDWLIPLAGGILTGLVIIAGFLFIRSARRYA